jgi:archaellum component FlaG (FlaF/FlaG flagellin family)
MTSVQLVMLIVCLYIIAYLASTTIADAIHRLTTAIKEANK